MNIKPFIVITMLVGCVGGYAYQAGPTSKPNFGNAATTQDQDKESSTSQKGGRMLNSYGSTHRNWSQGVQTQTVQTTLPVASDLTSSTPKKDEKKAENDKKQKVAATEDKAKNVTASSKPSEEQQGATPKNAGTTDPSAMLQQLQGMQDMMKNLPNMGAATGGTQANPAAAAGTAAMPAGMPDMSALMNMAGTAGGAMPQQPKK